MDEDCDSVFCAIYFYVSIQNYIKRQDKTPAKAKSKAAMARAEKFELKGENISKTG